MNILEALRRVQVFCPLVGRPPDDKETKSGRQFRPSVGPDEKIWNFFPMATSQTCFYKFYKTANARSRCSVQTQKTFFENFAMLARILAYSSMNFKNWVVFQSMDLYFSDSTS